MKTFVTATSLAIGASAAILPRNDECCFQLSASGGTSGTLGQLDDGQNRVGGGLGQATYCINGGKITDESGRGCILTAPTTQFQCDKGASPDGGFSVDGNGMLQHDSDNIFYACPADQGEYNIYTQKVDGQPKCVEVSLSTGGKCTAQQSMTSPVQSYQSQTCPPQQTVTKVEQGKPTTVYETEYKPTTVYKTEQNTQYKPTTEYKPTTVYKTETQQNTQYKPTTEYKPTTVYQTKTVEETEYVTKPTTVYQTKTIQDTVTAEKPTTIYQTKTMEETEYVTKPTTVYETKTIQSTITAKQPTTVYQTKTVEETETQHAQPTTITKVEQGKPSTITQYVTKVQTRQGKDQTITKTEKYCPQQPTQEQPTQGGGKPTQTAPASACPTDLSGDYQYPHLIVPVSSEQPDQSYGTSYNGMMNSTMNSMFNFDIPASYQGKTCSLVFMFPKKSDLETSDYTFNGQGSVSVDHMASPCKESSSWNSAPKADEHMGSFSPQPGNSYVVATGNCAAGTTQGYEMSAEGGLAMEYFQDYNPSPLGLYITTC